MSQEINGSKIAKIINNHTKKIVQSLKQIPYLVAILVKTGNKVSDRANKLYVDMKARKAKSLGINSKNIILSKKTSNNKLLTIINQLNLNKNVTGILLQLPLPKQLNAERAEEKIDAKKDVDGVNPVNIGKLTTSVNKKNNFYLTGATPTGIITMLKYYYLHTKENQYRLHNLHLSKAKVLNQIFMGKKAVILGRSNIVGRPVALMLINLGCEVTVLNHKYSADGYLRNYTRDADIIISATGHPNTIMPTSVGNFGTVMIDAGEDTDPITKKLCGDINESAKKISLAYSPVPHGVGPMTIATLMRNVADSVRYE